MRRIVFRAIPAIWWMLLVAPVASATVAPPSDVLRVELSWLDQSSPQWQARIRLVRYATRTVPPGTPIHTALAMRIADSLAISDVDSALVVLPGTQIPAPGFPLLVPHAGVTASFRTHAAAPAGGFWRGVLGVAATASVLPNEPVDVCWFVRVPSGTAEAAVVQAIRGARFGSAPASVTGTLGVGVAFKAVGSLRADAAGGGSIDPYTIEP